MDLTLVGEAAGELLEEVGELTGIDPKMAAVAIFVLALLAVFLFTKPIRWILKLLINTGIGFAALWVLNTYGAQFGIELAMNWQNAVVTGVFGIPGVAVLLALRWAGLM